MHENQSVLSSENRVEICAMYARFMAMCCLTASVFAAGSRAVAPASELVLYLGVAPGQRPEPIDYMKRNSAR